MTSQQLQFIETQTDTDEDTFDPVKNAKLAYKWCRGLLTSTAVGAFVYVMMCHKSK